jgi:predicted RNase H-like HicB family nuclease
MTDEISILLGWEHVNLTLEAGFGRIQTNKEVNVTKRKSTEKTPEYSYVIKRESNGRYTGKVLELSGCYTEGQSVASVAAKLDREVEDWLNHAKREGIPIPKPKDNIELQKGNCTIKSDVDITEPFYLILCPIDYNVVLKQTLTEANEETERLTSLTGKPHILFEPKGICSITKHPVRWTY